MAKFYVVRETDDTTRPVAAAFDELGDAVTHARENAEGNTKGEAYLVLAPVKRFKKPPPQDPKVVEETI